MPTATDFDHLLELTKQDPGTALGELLKLLPVDEHALRFQALLLQARHRLGLPAVTSGDPGEIPEDKQAEYEEAIRVAAREVGQELLDRKRLPDAWTYYRLIGETQAVAAAIDAFEPSAEASEKFSDVLQIALAESVNPKRGFDLVLEHHGVCNAITTVAQTLYQPGPTRQHAIRKLVRRLHADLQDRVREDLQQREEEPPAHLTLPQLLTVRTDLFRDDNYHVDLSHLSSVVQFALELPPSEETQFAEELCAYGEHLNPRFQPPSDPPFSAGYSAYRRYFAALNRKDLEENLVFFESEAVQVDDNLTAPAEVLVHLLAALDRPAEALAAYQRFLAEADPRTLACPSPIHLCRKLGDYGPLQELCRNRKDLVGFVAAILASPSV